MADVNLQFTQEDRDLLMEINQTLKTFMESHIRHDRRLDRHHRRIARLEKWLDEGRGMAKAVKWIWAAFAALAAAFGIHLKQH